MRRCSKRWQEGRRIRKLFVRVVRGGVDIVALVVCCGFGQIVAGGGARWNEQPTALGRRRSAGFAMQNREKQDVNNRRNNLAL